LIVTVAPTTKFVPKIDTEALGEMAYVSVFGDTLLIVGCVAATVKAAAKLAPNPPATAGFVT
jgi:hypothetical protein